jgi:hypothetical protein
VECDAHTITQVVNLELFQRLLALCAGRVGQLVNYSALEGEVGVSDKIPLRRLFASLFLGSDPEPSPSGSVAM